MQNLYTPFLADVTKKAGEAFIAPRRGELLQSAYMGDPEALNQLAGVDPAAASQIENVLRRRQQDQMSAEDRQIALDDRKRKMAMENRDMLSGIYKQIAATEDFDQAKTYADEQVSQLIEQGIIDEEMASTMVLTPEVHEQLKQQLAPSLKEELGLSKQILELEKLQKEVESMGEGDSKEQLEVQKLMLEVKEKLQKMDEKSEQQTKAEEGAAIDSTNAISNIDDLLADNAYRVLYGTGQDFIPTIRPESVALEAKRDQVVALLTLANRQKLKGQGTITDKEEATLAKSATILARDGISEEAAEAELRNVREVFAEALRRQDKEVPELTRSAPQEAIDFLIANPNLKDQFKAKYGYLPEGI